MPLRPDLASVTTANVVSNVLTPYMLVRLELNETSLRVEWTDALLGLIPRTRRSLEIPRPTVRRIARAHRFYPSRLAAALVVAATVWISPALLQFPLAALSLVLLILSYIGTVRIESQTSATTVPVCLLLRRSLDQFLATVEDSRAVGGDG
jgi:hypothetical protein